MEAWLIHIPLVTAICYFLYRGSRTMPLSYSFLPALLLKLSAGIVLGLIFKYYYPGGDTWTMFASAERFTRVLYNRPADYLQLLFYNDVTYMLPVDQVLITQPRALFFTKLISIVNGFSYNSYWITSLYFSLFSFFALWLLANKLVKIFKVNEAAAACSFLFFPSVIFWSAGILKETVMVGAICLIIFSALRLAFSGHNVQFPDVLIIIFMSFLLWKIKYYYFAVALPVVFAFIISIIAGRGTAYQTKNWFRTSVFFVTLFVSLLLATLVHPNLNLSALGQAIITNYHETLRISPETDFSFPGIKNDFFIFLSYTPKALFTGLFRPFIWEADLNFQILTAIENFIILFLVIVSLAYAVYSKNFTAKSWSTAAGVYIAILAVMLAFASPNFGALARYKVGFLPFFVLLITNRNPAFCWFFRRNTF